MAQGKTSAEIATAMENYQEFKEQHAAAAGEGAVAQANRFAISWLTVYKTTLQ